MTSDERPRKEDGSGLTEIDTRPIIFEPVSGAHLARTMNHNDPRKLFPHLRGRPRSFRIPFRRILFSSWIFFASGHNSN